MNEILSVTTQMKAIEHNFFVVLCVLHKIINKIVFSHFFILAALGSEGFLFRLDPAQEQIIFIQK